MVKFISLSNSFVWAAGNVYGSHDESFRRDFLDGLADLKLQWQMPWCLGGDFNMIRFSHEKRGGARLCRSMELFSNFIND